VIGCGSGKGMKTAGSARQIVALRPAGHALPLPLPRWGPDSANTIMIHGRCPALAAEADN
jgi:hypothetical protein